MTDWSFFWFSMGIRDNYDMGTGGPRGGVCVCVLCFLMFVYVYVYVFVCVCMCLFRLLYMSMLLCFVDRSLEIMF